jgi:hypothetical protein
MKQSSIDWLLSFIEPSLTPEQKQFFSIVIEKAKPMHKDEIENAVKQGWDYNEEGLVQWKARDCARSVARLMISNLKNETTNKRREEREGNR